MLNKIIRRDASAMLGSDRLATPRRFVAFGAVRQFENALATRYRSCAHTQKGHKQCEYPTSSWHVGGCCRPITSWTSLHRLHAGGPPPRNCYVHTFAPLFAASARNVYLRYFLLSRFIYYKSVEAVSQILNVFI